MGIIVRQGVLNTIVLSLGTGLGFVLTIYLFPHILNPEQYGLTRVLLSLSIIGSKFAQLGIKNTILRYFPYFRSDQNSDRGLLFWTLVIPFVGLSILIVLLWSCRNLIIDLYSDQSSLFTEYFWYVIPLLVFTVYYAVLNSYVTALYNSFLGSLTKDVLLRVGIMALLFVYMIGSLNFSSFVFYFVLIHGIQPFILLAYLAYRGEIQLTPDFSYLTPAFTKNIITYSSYALIGGLTTVMVGNIDVIMLSFMSGLNDTAIYFVAFSVGTVIAVPKRSLGKIATPVISSAFKRNDLHEIDYIYKQSSLNQLLAGLLLYVGIWANLGNLFRILPDDYASGGTVILVVGLGKLCDMASGVNGVILNISKYFRFNLYSNLCLILLTIITNYLLIPPLGIIGAGIASALSLFIFNVIKFIYVWKKMYLQPFKVNILYLLPISLITLFLGLSIPTISNIYLDIVVRSFSMAALYLSILYYSNLSKEFNQLVENLLRHIRRYVS